MECSDSWGEVRSWVWSEYFRITGGEIVLAENPVSSSNSKHIDVRRHFLRELVDRKSIEVEHVISAE